MYDNFATGLAYTRLVWAPIKYILPLMKGRLLRAKERKRLYVQTLLCQEWEISEKKPVKPVHTHFNMYFSGWSLLIEFK